MGDTSGRPGAGRRGRAILGSGSKPASRVTKSLSDGLSNRFLRKTVDRRNRFAAYSPDGECDLPTRRQPKNRVPLTLEDAPCRQLTLSQLTSSPALSAPAEAPRSSTSRRT